MTPISDSDRVLLTHIAKCIARVREYTRGERRIFSGRKWSRTR